MVNIETLVTIVCSIAASSGFWAYITARHSKKDVKTEMLIGLAHDRITCLGAHYIARGYISNDEYENLHDYLYVPYSKMGGNGSAKRIMDNVTKLPVKKTEEVGADRGDNNQ